MPDRPAVLSRSRHRGHRPRDYAFAIIITIIIIITTRNCDFSSLLLPAESKVPDENEGRTIGGRNQSPEINRGPRDLARLLAVSARGIGGSPSKAPENAVECRRVPSSAADVPRASSHSMFG